MASSTEERLRHAELDPADGAIATELKDRVVLLIGGADRKPGARPDVGGAPIQKRRTK